MLSPRALVRGNPARAKFAAENRQPIAGGCLPWFQYQLNVVYFH